MKLTAEHIGRRVRNTSFLTEGILILLAIDDDHVWLKSEIGLNHSSWRNVNWELVEEPELPSERIEKLCADEPRDLDPLSMVVNRINAIKKYLDEVLPKLMEKMK